MKNKIISINVFMLILIFFMLTTLGIDYLTYAFHFKYIISFFISIIFNLLLLYKIKKKIIITNDFEKKDLLFFGVLFFIFIITIVYPDRTFDSFNYHLYLQENPFGNKINNDFFAGKNLNSFSYAFPDRLFYIFRFFLGYRLGVILNYLILIIVYYQIKEIVKKILPNSKSIVPVIISLLVSTSLSFIDIVDSYYIDLLSLVLLLEIFRIIMCERMNDDNNTMLLCYLGLLFGFCFTVKISNAFSIIVLFIMFIINNKHIKKYVSIKNIILTLLVFIIPFFIYMLYTYLSTGNPVFPFYNTIFKSKYFGNWNWLDKRFGPQTIFDRFLYPYTMFFNKQMTCDIGIIEPIWSLGYFISIFYILYYIVRKVIKKDDSSNNDSDNNKLILAITTFFIYFFWFNFQLGYTRYGFISLALGSICTYIFIYDTLKNKKYIITILLNILILYNYYYSFNNYARMRKDWIYNNIFNNGRDVYKYNLKRIFTTGNEVKETFEKGSVWGIIYNNSGLAQMINNSVPIININDSADNDYTKQLLNKKLDNATHIYSLVDSLDFDGFINRLNQTDFKIIKIKDVIHSEIIGRPNSFVYIFELGKEGKNSNSYESFSTEKIINVKDNNTIKFFIGIDRWTRGAYEKNGKVTFIGKNNDEVDLEEIEISNNGYLEYVELDVRDYDEIIINVKDYYLMILNIEKE